MEDLGLFAPDPPCVDKFLGQSHTLHEYIRCFGRSEGFLLRFPRQTIWPIRFVGDILP